MEELLETNRKLYYEVTDNSYCIRLDTLKDARLVQERTKWYSPDSKEVGAEFEIISAPFNCNINIEFLEEMKTYRFIIVKSTRTDICYRVLYNKYNVYRRVYKKEYPLL